MIFIRLFFRFSAEPNPEQARCSDQVAARSLRKSGLALASELRRGPERRINLLDDHHDDDRQCDGCVRQHMRKIWPEPFGKKMHGGEE